MKIAKKFMALALVAVLGVGSATVGVSAAGSRTTAMTVSQEQSAIYKIDQKIEETDAFKALTEEFKDVADAFTKVRKGEMDMPEFADILTKLAGETEDEAMKAAIEELVGKLAGKEFATAFDQFTVVDKDAAEKDKNEDGRYEVEISVPTLTDAMENVQVIVYSKDEPGKWFLIDPSSIDKESKTIKVALPDNCFFAVICDEVKTAE